MNTTITNEKKDYGTMIVKAIVIAIIATITILVNL